MKHIVFNIETIPDQHLPAELMPKLDDFSAPSNWKDETKIAQYKQKELESAIEKLSLSPLTGQVVCVGLYKMDGLTWNDDNFIVSYGDNESGLIDFFANEALDSNDVKLVGFNSKSFDMPFLMVKMAIYSPTVAFIPVSKLLPKYDNSHHVDVYYVLSNYETKKGSLKDWSVRFGGPNIYGDGSQVYDWYKKQSWFEIVEHCKSNVKATEHIYSKLIMSGIL